jgi:alpha-tubulin suppressor-like RCC1 family protein
LGNGATGAGTGSDVPVQVGTGTSWTKISAGLYFACGLQSDASAWCWGDNRFGQLGDGTTTATDTPGHVGASGWKSISAGGFFTCGVETDGTAWCWGSNGDGEVGDASTTDRDVPTQVGTDATWSSISAGYFFACGVKTDHTAWCWGYDLYGQLGNGHSGASANTDAPSAISGSGKWASTSAGVDGACGVQTDQTAWCWGRNDNGQLGDGQDGALTDSDTPEFIGARLLHFI